jgi:hypothetical protein
MFILMSASLFLAVFDAVISYAGVASYDMRIVGWLSDDLERI